VKREEARGEDGGCWRGGGGGTSCFTICFY